MKGWVYWVKLYGYRNNLQNKDVMNIYYIQIVQYMKLECGKELEGHIRLLDMIIRI